jgi:hypothetical protein
VLALAVLLTVATATASAGRTAAPDDLVYVAMGDSYTSGPLVLPHDTTWVPEDCGQSVRNYPHLAAAAIGATSFTDVSCGSATIDDLYTPQGGLPAGGVNAPQLDALGSNADVVTLGMGGNDVGFVGAALDCIRLVGPPAEQPCSPAYTAGGHDKISEKIAEVGPELGQAIRDIHARAPHAEVFIVSYPTALPDSGLACWPYVPILPEDMPYLVAKFKEMNAMLAEQAAANDATYIDIYTPSIGHDACQIPAVAWVNGMVVVPPSYPAHPNEFGLAHSGAFVAAAIDATLAASPPAAPTEPPPAPSTTATPVTTATVADARLPVTGDEARLPVAGLLLLLAGAATGLQRASRHARQG